MSIVTGLQEDKQVVRVSLDGLYAFSLRKKDFARYPLQTGDVCDMDAYCARFGDAQHKACLDAALTLLERGPKTEWALRDRLLHKGFLELSVARTVERLKELNLLDDLALARRAVEVRASRGDGKYALRRKLLTKGVSREDADEALNAVSDDAQCAGARAAAEKLLRNARDEDTRKTRARVSQALARRGYSWDVIGTVVDAVLPQSDWSET